LIRPGALAWALVLAYALALIGSVALAERTGTLNVRFLFFIALSGYAVVGGLVAARRPGNPIGWLLLVAPLASAVGVLAEQLSSYGHVTAPGAVPLVTVATWLATWSWQLFFGPLVFVVFLFPTGRLPSRRWRPIAWGVGLLLVVVTVIFAFGTPRSGAHPEITNPYVIPALVPIFEAVAAAFWIYIFVFGLAVASLVARYRGAARMEKQQLKWIVMAGITMVACFVGSEIGPSPLSDWGFFLAVLALPIAIGIGILRYRLLDIDLLINRAIVYAGLTATLAAVFFTGLVFLQALLRPVTGANELGVAISTLLSFALFQPVRRRIQSVVDRRFDRSRYDAERTLDAFSSRLGDEIDLDALHADLVAVVRSTMAPNQVSLWLRERAQ
jgi:hypothetical protein